jgi:cell wall-associated NlpC family hydrolase
LHLPDRDGRATFRSPQGHERRRPEWNYSGSRHIAKSDLRPDEEVFFKEGGSKHITHVDIHSGNGRLVHASSYGGKVVEKEMKRIGGYFGAKRFRSR